MKKKSKILRVDWEKNAVIIQDEGEYVTEDGKKISPKPLFIIDLKEFIVWCSALREILNEEKKGEKEGE